VVEQGLVRLRVGAIHAAGKHRDRDPAAREGAPMSGAVDPEGGSGHHRAAGLYEGPADVCCQLITVGRGRSGSDDCDGRAE
jgi:hypothetical protein